MPSSAHEVLLVALREQPSLLTTLVARLANASLPGGLQPADAAVRFTKAAEVHPDLLFLDPDRRWVVVELQRARDPSKRRRWLLIAALLLDQTGVLGDIVVITARRDVARWAQRVAHLETPLGTTLALTPLVIHLDAAAAEALLDPLHPELALFAAWAMHHRHGPKAQAVVERAFELTDRLPPQLRTAQMHAMFSVLSPRMLARLQEMAMNVDKIPETPAARRVRLLFEQFEKRGEAEGLAKGEAKGRIQGKLEALLAMLEARGLSPSEAQRAVLLECDDAATLDRWIVQAATARSMRALLAPAEPPRPTGSPRRRPSSARRKR